MPAAAVIPAPIVYISVVAVKTLVVGFWVGSCGPPKGVALLGKIFLLETRHVLYRACRAIQKFYFE